MPLSWDKPLAGRRIAVTRPREQANRLSALLEDLGATVIEFPTIEIRPVKRLPDIGTLDRYDWIVFTSRNAVRFFSEALPKLGVTPDYGAVKVAAVGPGTKEAAEAHGIPVTLAADRHLAEGLLDALTDADPDLSTRRILIPQGNLARDLLPDRLRALGADVSVAVFYETALPDVPRGETDRLIAAQPDAVIFTSGSTAKNFVKLVGDGGLRSLARARTLFASIGPQTTAAAEACGIPIGLTPKNHDLSSLADALAAHFGRMRMN